MFGAPQQPSKAEMEAQEQTASVTVKQAIATCVLLYLSPFAVEYIQKLV